VAREPDPYCDLIIPGTLPVEKVDETEYVLAFHHPRPSFAPAHVVLVPKKHVVSLEALTTEDAHLVADMMTKLSRVSAAVSREHGGAQVLTNVGGYQHSRHLHWLVVNDPRLRGFPPDEGRPRSTSRGAEQWLKYWVERQWEK